jgi:hypothetical protein
MCQAFDIFCRGHTAFEPGIPKTCVLPIIWSPNHAFNIPEVSIAFFPQFIAKFDTDALFFQVCHFLDTQKLQMEQHTLELNNTLLNSHTCYNLFPSKKGHSSSHLMVSMESI